VTDLKLRVGIKDEGKFLGKKEKGWKGLIG
jgi:hypothetical protein